MLWHIKIILAKHDRGKIDEIDETTLVHCVGNQVRPRYGLQEELLLPALTADMSPGVAGLGTTCLYDRRHRIVAFRRRPAGGPAILSTSPCYTSKVNSPMLGTETLF